MTTKTLGSIDCYGCNGTGKVIGWGDMHGRECLCVAHCLDCDEPFAWEHDDEVPPRLCDACKAEESCHV